MKTILCLSIVFSALLITFGMIHAEPAMPDSIVRVGACATPGIAWGVFVQGDYAYVAGRSYLSVIDISVPSTPTVVGSLTTFDIRPVAVFVQDTVAHTVQIGPEFATASVGDPTSPYQLGWCLIPMFSVEPKGLMVVGSLAYVPDANRGLQVVDVSDPTAPAVIGSLDTEGIARDLHLRDTLVFVADGDSLQVVNVSDPTLPLRIGAVVMPSTCYDVFVVDTFAYVVCQSNSGGDASLQVVDISNAASPQIVASVNNINGDAFDLWVSGNQAFVAATDYWGYWEGTERRVGVLRPESASWRAADVEGGVRVIDISDPLSPSLVASYDTPGDPRGIFAVGDLVFVADYDSLQILQHVIVGVEEKSVVSSQQPAIRLGQNRPNPFHGSTAISYSLPVAGSVALAVHDLAGRLVETIVDEEQGPGVHEVRWDTEDKASGIYFYSLQAGDFTDIKKMVLLR